MFEEYASFIRSKEEEEGTVYHYSKAGRMWVSTTESRRLAAVRQFERDRQLLRERMELSYV